MAWLEVSCYSFLSFLSCFFAFSPFSFSAVPPPPLSLSVCQSVSLPSFSVAITLSARSARLPSLPPTSSTESAPESDQRGNNWRSVSLFRNIRCRRRCIPRPSPNRLFLLLFSPGFFKAIASFFFANAPLLFRSLPVVWKLVSVTVATLLRLFFFHFFCLHLPKSLRSLHAHTKPAAIIECNSFYRGYRKSHLCSRTK